MKRAYGLSIAVVALAANLMLAGQSYAIFRACCASMPQPVTCSHCHTDNATPINSFSRGCCLPVANATPQKASSPVPESLRLPTLDVLPTCAVLTFQTPQSDFNFAATSHAAPPATPDILVQHSRLNI